MENRQNTKKIMFQKLWKKPEIVMVLTVQFDKNLLRYRTFNLQRLFRTVLVCHFKAFVFRNPAVEMQKIKEIHYPLLTQNQMKIFFQEKAPTIIKTAATTQFLPQQQQQNQSELHSHP